MAFSMDYLIEALFYLLVGVWQADERPEARRLVLGCVGVLVVIAVVIWLVWWLR